jgi:hypothetical protein
MCKRWDTPVFPQGSLVFLVFYMVFYGVPKFGLHFLLIF